MDQNYTITYISSQKARKGLLGDEYKAWLKVPKGDSKKEFLLETVKPILSSLIEFKHRPRATKKHLPYLYDITDSYIVAIAK